MCIFYVKWPLNTTTYFLWCLVVEEAAFCSGPGGNYVDGDGETGHQAPRAEPSSGTVKGGSFDAISMDYRT